MKYITAIILSFFLLTPAAHAQIGFFGEMDIVRIGASARGILNEYLAADYQRHCGKYKGVLPDECQPVKPYYTSAAIPRDAVYRRIPDEVIKKIGFIQPGAVYMQVGYTVYLVRWPTKIIYDHVTLWDF